MAKNLVLLTRRRAQVDAFSAVVLDPRGQFARTGLTCHEYLYRKSRFYETLAAAAAPVVASVQETPGFSVFFRLWRPVSRSIWVRFGSFLDR